MKFLGAHYDYELYFPEDSPRFKHGCPNCSFLGQYFEWDLYHCTQSGIPTVIARFGNKGPDYMSGMNLTNAAITEAKYRALKKGLLEVA